MALRRPGVNFVTSPSGLLVPSSADNPGLEAVDVTFELEPGTDTQVLTTVGSDVEWSDAPGDPADDEQVWLPLTTVVGGNPELVWDADDSLIPTLTPLA